ncbi:ROK family transcriptional regulator [Sphingomonas sp. Leaf10]|uniref:ROK family transcriptional regulator n=1 Tax=Sphingomonas sp. Leaf10 TaxID=1735676 RepID=UPI0007020466|nr:ROK family transcriptional regulator [Sphingomonas sp. Leaf10]KQM38747.1 ROK family transcriptional regulator [Sphingomonas sp. Leaf10]
MTDCYAGAFSSRFLRADGQRTTTANERVVLSLLSRRGAASRAELARVTGLAPHSVGRLIEPLIERGLVMEGAREIAGRGKPGAPLRLNPDAAFSAGVSVMTDAMTLALVDLAGAVRASVSAPLERDDFDAGARQIAAMIDGAITQAGLDPMRRLGTGVGVTGYFIGDGARLNPPAALDSWALRPLDTLLAEALSDAVWVDNDGNVAAVGEAMLGAGRTCPDFAYLYFAAGFGGGVIARGAPLRGASGNAGEFASVLPEGWYQPNLENLRRHLAEHGMVFDGLRTMLRDVDFTVPAVDAWLDRCTPSLNLVVSAIFAALDPAMIVLGGRLPPDLAERMIARVHVTNPARRDHHRPMPRLVPSTIGSDAAAIGAAMLPTRAAFFQ